MKLPPPGFKQPIPDPSDRTLPEHEIGQCETCVEFYYGDGPRKPHICVDLARHRRFGGRDYK